jgi:hypothetical protein
MNQLTIIGNNQRNGRTMEVVSTEGINDFLRNLLGNGTSKDGLFTIDNMTEEFTKLEKVKMHSIAVPLLSDNGFISIKNKIQPPSKLIKGLEEWVKLMRWINVDIMADIENYSDEFHKTLNPFEARENKKPLDEQTFFDDSEESKALVKKAMSIKPKPSLAGNYLGSEITFHKKLIRGPYIKTYKLPLDSLDESVLELTFNEAREIFWNIRELINHADTSDPDYILGTLAGDFNVYAAATEITDVWWTAHSSADGDIRGWGYQLIKDYMTILTRFITLAKR